MLANEEIDGATGAIVVADRKIVIPGSPDFEDGRAGSNQFDQRGGATQLTADWRGTAEYEAHRAVSWSEFEAKPQRIKSETAKRTGTTAKAIDLIGSGLPIMESYRRAAAEFGVSAKSVERWVQVKIGGHKTPKCDRPDLPIALLDQRNGRPRAHTYDELTYEYCKSDYLRQDRPTFTACYRRAVMAARTRGVTDDQIPSAATLKRRLYKEVPRQSLLYARKGEQALHRSYPAQRRDRSGLYAGQAVNGDGFRWNVAVVWPDGELCRALMWYWKDEYSGKILAWRLDKTENWGLIRLTIGDLIREYCIPEWFTIGNTMAAAAKQITGGSKGRFRFRVKEEEPLGLITLLGSRVCNTLPRVGGSSKSGERGGGDGIGISLAAQQPRARGSDLTLQRAQRQPAEQFRSKSSPRLSARA